MSTERRALVAIDLDTLHSHLEHQWITILNRESLQLHPKIAFRTADTPGQISTLRECIARLAKIGGYLARKSDPPLGNTVIWHGINKFYELKDVMRLH